MPLPAAYDDATLAAFLADELSTTAAALGWNASTSHVAEAVNDVTGLLGHPVAEETTIAGVMKVRALARWRGYRRGWLALATQYDLKSGASSLTRSQWFSQFERALHDAEAEAAIYPEAQAAMAGAGGVISIAQVSDPADPYGWNVVRSEFG